jgi:hypothetical protein
MDLWNAEFEITPNKESFDIHTAEKEVMDINNDEMIDGMQECKIVDKPLKGFFKEDWRIRNEEECGGQIPILFS